MEIIRHSNTCLIRSTKSSKFVEAEVADFSEKKILNVVLNKSVKINMKWNGKFYKGRGAGMDFQSDGPKVIKTQTSIRG
jgi:hypothetical protein